MTNEDAERIEKIAVACDRCNELSGSALGRVCGPLLMDGKGWFYAKNGHAIPPADVLKEHEVMRVALADIENEMALIKLKFEQG